MKKRQVVFKNKMFNKVHVDKGYRFLVINREGAPRFINVNKNQEDLVAMFVGRQVDIVANEVIHRSNGEEQVLYLNLTHIKIHQEESEDG